MLPFREKIIAIFIIIIVIFYNLIMKTVLQILRKYAVLITNAFFVILKLTHCMTIYDELDLANYCTNQEEMCADAENSTHIVCEYYGKIGSSCSKFKEVHLDENNAKDIVMRINSVRASIATGIVMGKDRQKLPRGYGLMRVSWDSELAALAKIMIKQCLTTHKYSCAATDYFGSPMMSYMYANTSSSAVAIIDNIFSSWDATALQISMEDILHCPDLKVGEKSRYIKMVVGNLTNVGCALGIYKYDIRDDVKPTGHMICYLSHYARPGTQVYNTTPPAPGMGWSKCGCPPPLRETGNCLCVGLPKLLSLRRRNHNFTISSSEPQPTRKQHVTIAKQLSTQDQKLVAQAIDLEPRYHRKMELTQRNVKVIPQQHLRSQSTLKQQTRASSTGAPAPTCQGGGNCDPKIVMLPIFTIQNVPEHQRSRGKSNHRRFANTSLLRAVKAIYDVSYSDELYDEIPNNMSVRSQILRTLRKIRENPNIHFFSYEENLDPELRTMERSQRIMKSRDDRKEKTQKVMTLLDLLEKRGKKAQFNSQELIEFDTKMRKIYKAVLATHEDLEEMQF